MEIILKGYLDREVKPVEQWDSEVRKAVEKAIELTRGKRGFRSYTEVWRDCQLIVTIGHNIYTTTIEIRPPDMAVLRRRSNWHNGYAYYCNGHFWASLSLTKVELI